MKTSQVRTRIAPSPTGHPHIGTAYAALFNYAFAKQNNGTFILRIEDTDRGRYVEGSEQEIIDALKWLNLMPDEDPIKGGPFGPYRQSERLEIYKKHLQSLIDSGKAYYCDCTPARLEKVRDEQQKRGEIPHYDRKCRIDPPKDIKNAVVRLAIPQTGETVVEDKIRGEVTFQNKILDDQVLLKSDGYPTYHLASVVDDHLMEITHVIRAEEWLSSTPKHVLLYQAFGWQLPVFAHLPLLRNSDRSKISKRKNPVAVDFYKQEGYLPEALINFLGLMGWSMPKDQEIFTLEEMVNAFTFDRISPVGPVFDVTKLDWLNGEYIRKMSDEQLLVQVKNYSKSSAEQIKKVLPLVKERMKKLSDFDKLTSYFFSDSLEIDVREFPVKDKKKMAEILTGVKEEFASLNDWNKESLLKAMEEALKKLALSKTDVFQTIRVATTGSKASPPLDDTLMVLGKEKVEKRLDQALSYVC